MNKGLPFTTRQLSKRFLILASIRTNHCRFGLRSHHQQRELKRPDKTVQDYNFSYLPLLDLGILGLMQAFPDLLTNGAKAFARLRCESTLRCTYFSTGYRQRYYVAVGHESFSLKNVKATMSQARPTSRHEGVALREAQQ